MPNEMSELTPRRIAENLEFIEKAHLIKGLGVEYDEICESVNQATSIVRKVENKELVPMPLPQADDYSGLKVKYRIYHAEDNTPVEGDCFVLRPDKDPAAFIALQAYVLFTENSQLRRDITEWLNQIERKAKYEVPNKAKN